MIKVEKGDDLMGMMIAKVIGHGGRIPTLKSNVSGVAKPREDGGIIFEPDVLIENGEYLELNWNNSSEWYIPGVTIINLSNGDPIETRS